MAALHTAHMMNIMMIVDAGPPQNCQMHHQTKRSVHEGRCTYVDKTNLPDGILLTKNTLQDL